MKKKRNWLSFFSNKIRAQAYEEHSGLNTQEIEHELRRQKFFDRFYLFMLAYLYVCSVFVITHQVPEFQFIGALSAILTIVFLWMHLIYRSEMFRVLQNQLDDININVALKRLEMETSHEDDVETDEELSEEGLTLWIGDVDRDGFIDMP